MLQLFVEQSHTSIINSSNICAHRRRGSESDMSHQPCQGLHQHCAAAAARLKLHLVDSPVCDDKLLVSAWHTCRVTVLNPQLPEPHPCCRDQRAPLTPPLDTATRRRAWMRCADSGSTLTSNRIHPTCWGLRVWRSIHNV